jgi:uncharacterized membrane protein
MSPKPKDSESKFERAISHLLLIGVIASLFLIVFGITVFYGSYGNLNILETKAAFIRGENFFSFLYKLFQGESEQEKAFFLMTLGIMILILTPYARVVLSVLYFLWMKDFKYIWITSFVLIILTISLVMH